MAKRRSKETAGSDDAQEDIGTKLLEARQSFARYQTLYKAWQAVRYREDSDPALVQELSERMAAEELRLFPTVQELRGAGVQGEQGAWLENIHGELIKNREEMGAEVASVIESHMVQFSSLYYARRYVSRVAATPDRFQEERDALGAFLTPDWLEQQRNNASVQILGLSQDLRRSIDTLLSSVFIRGALLERESSLETVTARLARVEPDDDRNIDRTQEAIASHLGQFRTTWLDAVLRLRVDEAAEGVSEWAAATLDGVQINKKEAKNAEALRRNLRLFVRSLLANADVQSAFAPSADTGGKLEALERTLGTEDAAAINRALNALPLTTMYDKLICDQEHSMVRRSYNW